ncbi:MAG: ABC transporter ATP-binding protein [Acidobacteriota bacterium]|jgi:ABC-type multidrug transport system, ATPase component|nr:ABC transporter ATP-binding protein [Acidobacteriota bacterium]HNQ79809.1 ABC transporter ATP-binding protein [Candidatus Aminicenantes bacterium]MDD8010441.1 ABC transporter ATP-binding protein [Acidobacteriota bacterium]MDD8029205.1 ABC transporter ATP-binding protein [Acidobacteriota bacterium]MDD8033552.1 ABC transporter ATP-binding protein [Acidobacteriota bacterium]
MNIELRDVRFSYGPIRALDGVTLQIGEGACGLLGPNGAGKSTLLKVLLGFLRPEAGEGLVLGHDIRKDSFGLRRVVGYMPEDDCFIPGLDAVSFTANFGELSGMPRAEAMKRAHDVLYYVGLGESRYRLLETYSAGMKQRLKLAQALVHDPKILFLDEPTANLDPQGRSEILELISDITSKKDLHVLISSHILTDIEQTCSALVILNKGRVAAQGDLASLREVRFSLYEMKVKGEKGSFLEGLRRGGCRIEETEDGLLKAYLPEEMSRRDVFRLAAAAGVQVRHFVKSRTSLEDLFARTVGVD